MSRDRPHPGAPGRDGTRASRSDTRLLPVCPGRSCTGDQWSGPLGTCRPLPPGTQARPGPPPPSPPPPSPAAPRPRGPDLLSAVPTKALPPKVPGRAVLTPWVSRSLVGLPWRRAAHHGRGRGAGERWLQGLQDSGVSRASCRGVGARTQRNGTAAGQELSEGDEFLQLCF